MLHSRNMRMKLCVLLAALAAPAMVSCAESTLLSYFAAPSGTRCCTAEDTAGNIFIVYWKYASPSVTSYDISVMEFDPSFHYMATVSTNAPFFPNAAAVDPGGSLWVVGRNVLMKLTSGQTTTVALGGRYSYGETVGHAVGIDKSGNIYVAGTTNQTDFPVTPGAFQGLPSVSMLANLPGFQFGFVSKFSNTGVRLLSTVIFGVQTTCPSAPCGFPQTVPMAIAVDAGGIVTIAGTTDTVDYPVTANAAQSTCNCNEFAGNMFVTRLNAGFSGLIWSTFLGGTPRYTVMGETVSGISLEPDGGVVIAGMTTDPDFPTTTGTIEPALPAQATANYHGFVSRLNSIGTAWIFSTYLGGSAGETISGLQTDSQGNCWIAGATSSQDFPTPPGTLQLGPALVLEIASDGSHFLVSEHIPGGNDGGILSNPDGTLTVIGATRYFAGGFLSDNSGSLLRLPAGPVHGVSFLGVADSAATRPAGTVAPGEFLSLYGTGLGPAGGAGAEIDSAGRIGSALGGTTVSFDGQPMPLLWASDHQINVLAPYRIAAQSQTTLQVTTPAGSSQALNLTVVPTQPNIFTVVNQDGTVNGPDHPAALGSVLTLYGSGGGALSQSLPDGTIASTSAPATVAPVSVILSVSGTNYLCNNQTLPLVYSGPSPGLVVNALQVNFKLQITEEPTSGFNYCRYGPDIQLRVGNQGSEFFTIYWNSGSGL